MYTIRTLDSRRNTQTTTCSRYFPWIISTVSAVVCGIVCTVLCLKCTVYVVSSWKYYIHHPRERFINLFVIRNDFDCDVRIEILSYSKFWNTYTSSNQVFIFPLYSIKTTDDVYFYLWLFDWREDRHIASDSVTQSASTHKVLIRKRSKLTGFLEYRAFQTKEHYYTRRLQINSNAQNCY